MRVLLINKFLFPKGGDAISTLQTGQVLTEKGHDVCFWGMHHQGDDGFPLSHHFISEIDFNATRSTLEKIKAAGRIIFSFEAQRKLENVLREFKPDIVHLHNFAHQISPSILPVIHDWGIPVVMTMHDYKLVCPTYSLFREGKLCERCRNKAFYNCLRFRCTRQSRLQSFVNMAEMYLHHQILDLYSEISVFIAVSDFMSRKVKEMGFTGRVDVLPNACDVRFWRATSGKPDIRIAFVGRLIQEKGILTLMEAMRGLDLELDILGDGPLMDRLKNMIEIGEHHPARIRLLGNQPQDVVRNTIANAMAVIVPSEWYEPFGLTVIEAYASGKPVIAARIGALEDLVHHRRTGLLFEPGNVSELHASLQNLITTPEDALDWGTRARELVEQNYSLELYYHRLMLIYQKALARNIRH